jgi:uncharacterized protein YjiS (DUF1127 family)
MPNESSPISANRVVTLYNAFNSDGGGAAVAEPSGPVRRGASRAALYLAHVGALSQETPAAKVAERPEKTIWSSVFDFLVEGFANCGAALHPSVDFYLDNHMAKADAGSYEAFAANERKIVLSLVPSAARRGDDSHATNDLAMASHTLLEDRALADRGFLDRVLADQALPDQALPDQSQPNQNVAEPDALPAQEIGQPHRWNWLTSCWEVVTAIGTHMRREREIRKAVDDLAQLDDSILNDIGIYHRSQIEYAVRSGHDF